MAQQPPPLSNGYVCLAHTLMPAADAQLLEQRLAGLRYQLRTRDYSELGDPRHDTGVELYVHPDDQGRASGILQALLTGP